ncbi:hypothetical protein QNO07_14590, partial [Streptomyces sp. 549]|nr:hypothetical protein [Streptomyces sp. 549]
MTTGHLVRATAGAAAAAALVLGVPVGNASPAHADACAFSDPDRSLHDALEKALGGAPMTDVCARPSPPPPSPSPTPPPPAPAPPPPDP